MINKSYFFYSIHVFVYIFKMKWLFDILVSNIDHIQIIYIEDTQHKYI